MIRDDLSIELELPTAYNGVFVQVECLRAD